MKLFEIEKLLYYLSYYLSNLYKGNKIASLEAIYRFLILAKAHTARCFFNRLSF